MSTSFPQISPLEVWRVAIGCGRTKKIGPFSCPSHTALDLISSFEWAVLTHPQHLEPLVFVLKPACPVPRLRDFRLNPNCHYSGTIAMRRPGVAR